MQKKIQSLRCASQLLREALGARRDATEIVSMRVNFSTKTFAIAIRVNGTFQDHHIRQSDRAVTGQLDEVFGRNMDIFQKTRGHTWNDIVVVSDAVVSTFLFGDEVAELLGGNSRRTECVEGYIPAFNPELSSCESCDGTAEGVSDRDKLEVLVGVGGLLDGCQNTVAGV